VQGLFAGPGLSLQAKPSGGAADYEDFGERSAVDVVAGGALIRGLWSMFDVSDAPHQGRLTVSQLRAYWRLRHEAEVGARHRTLYFSEMPLWDEVCEALDWESHLPTDGHFGKKEYGYWGVYRLIALTEDRSETRPAALNRIAGTDTTGTLYIGESTELSARLNGIRRSGWGHRNEDSHDAIKMLSQLSCLNYLPDKIGIVLHFTDVRDTELVERHLIWSYMNTFGDTPPLNYRVKIPF
jgi:hypothetical protein